MRNRLDGLDGCPGTIRMSHMKLVPIEGGEGDQFDVLNAMGHWLGWVSRLGDLQEDEGRMHLMSTSAPLGYEERQALADKVARLLGEPVEAYG